MDRFIHMGLVAATEAVEDSGWKPETEEDKCRTGVMIGSGIGGLQTIYDASITVHEGRARRLSPFFIPSALINLVSGHVSIKYGFQGQTIQLSQLAPPACMPLVMLRALSCLVMPM